MYRAIIFLLFIHFAQSVFSQGEIYGNCFYQHQSGRVVLRVGLRNHTGSSTGQMNLTGMRFGFQFNPNAVTYAGYRSYMNLNSNPGTGLDDASFISFFGQDTKPNEADIDLALGSSRTARIKTGGNKVMQMRFVNRSTTQCNNTIPINPGEIKVLIDIYFTLNHQNPEYYHLTDSDYGFGDPEFIAQFLTKNDGGHTGDLTDQYKEITLVVIRQSNSNNPYQPFDVSSCLNNNVAPITINADDINFVTPVNGILSCSLDACYVQHHQRGNQLMWKVYNNELIAELSVKKRNPSGSFKTIDVFHANSEAGTVEYRYLDSSVSGSSYAQYQIVLHTKSGGLIFGPVVMAPEREAATDQIAVFPNPAANFIHVKIPEDRSTYNLRIYDFTGRVWINQTYPAGKHLVNIGQIPSGICMLEIGDSKTARKQFSRFVKE